MERARNSHRSPRGESRMTILAKIVSLLSLTRVYNIALIAAAQYLSCIFFFTSDRRTFRCSPTRIFSCW